MIRHPLAARRALVIAPHPDDEVIGAWALIARLRRRRARVEVMIVSDGGASHPGSARWPRERLVKTRRRETLRAMARLAVPPSRVRFAALPDGELGARPRGVARAIGRALRRARWPDLIVGPLGDDAHADHRAVANAIARLRRRGERRLGYRVWPHAAPRDARALRVRLTGAAIAAKRHAVRGYRTQCGLITDAEAGFAITARQLCAFVRPDERFTVLA